MFASIRQPKGQGNAALYVRARNATQFWDWVAGAWSATLTAACKAWLTEGADDSDTNGNSRYAASLSPPAGGVVLEYVQSDGTVLAEDEAFNQSAALHSASSTTLLTVR